MIRKDIVRIDPALAGDSTLQERLERARQWAQKAGLRDGQAMTEFLYLEADNPGFYLKPAIALWLRKSGAPAEERFETLLNGVRHEQKYREEQKLWQQQYL